MVGTHSKGNELKFTATINVCDDEFGGNARREEIEFYDVKSYYEENDWFILVLENGDLHATRRYVIQKFSLTKE